MILICIIIAVLIIFYSIIKFSCGKGIPSTIFYTKQYIGHARYKCPFPENTLLLYHYLVHVLHYKIIEGDVVFTFDGYPILNHGVVADVYKNGKQYKVDIRRTKYGELLTYSISPDMDVQFTSVEEFVQFGKMRDVCVMIDLTFHKYTFENIKMLYCIVKKYNMQNKTIWGDVNVFKLSILDRGLICQTGGSWGIKLLIKGLLNSLLCKQLIVSFAYYGGNVEDFREIVRYGHKLGFLMKVATVNDEIIADRFWKIGADLITTDCLTNDKIYEKGSHCRCV